MTLRVVKNCRQIYQFKTQYREINNFPDQGKPDDQTTTGKQAKTSD